MKKITVITRTHYGKMNLYVKGEAEKPIRLLTGKQTVNVFDLKHLKQLGHEIEIDSDSETKKTILDSISQK